MANKYTNLSNLFQAIADEIRKKKNNDTNLIIANNLPEAIASIYVGADATILAEDILDGKIACKNQQRITGTMPNMSSSNIGYSSDFPSTPVHQNSEIIIKKNTDDVKRLLFRLPSKGYYPETSRISAELASFGNAETNNVLSNKTFVSQNAFTENSANITATGTMPDRSDATVTGISYNTSYLNTAITDTNEISFANNTDGITRLCLKPGDNGFGYYDNKARVATNVENLGDATTDQVLKGKTFTSKNGLKISGTIPSKAAATITPGTTNQVINAGQYLSGAQTIKGDANLISENILSGKSIFGVKGSLTAGKTVKMGTFEITNIKEDISVSHNCGFIPSYIFLILEDPASGFYGVEQDDRRGRPYLTTAVLYDTNADIMTEVGASHYDDGDAYLTDWSSQLGDVKTNTSSLFEITVNPSSSVPAEGTWIWMAIS